MLKMQIKLRNAIMKIEEKPADRQQPSQCAARQYLVPTTAVTSVLKYGHRFYIGIEDLLELDMRNGR